MKPDIETLAKLIQERKRVLFRIAIADGTLASAPFPRLHRADDVIGYRFFHWTNMKFSEAIISQGLQSQYAHEIYVHALPTNWPEIQAWEYISSRNCDATRADGADKALFEVMPPGEALISEDCAIPVMKVTLGEEPYKRIFGDALVMCIHTNKIEPQDIRFIGSFAGKQCAATSLARSVGEICNLMEDKNFIASYQRTVPPIPKEFRW